MLKRSLLVVALACGCSPAALSNAARAPSSASARAESRASEAAIDSARPRHARRVARLAPPFAATGLTRRVPESEPMTAFAVAP